jgi:acyl-homoserine lactone synthase
MLITVDPASNAADAAMRGMFEARKRVFVDLLGWDLPVLAGRYEVDQFDDAHARYLILTDREHRHLASARLLPTTRPHILGDLFAELCEDAPPQGPHIYEITRFCLERSASAQRRRDARNQLVSALADYALANGITAYTGVAEIGWLQQILAFGWRCRPLGMPKQIDGMVLGALRIEITPATPALLAAACVYARPADTIIEAEAA